jgi:hypothetical protein
MFFHNRWSWWLNMMRESLQPWFSEFATHQSLQGGRSAGAAVEERTLSATGWFTGALVTNQGVVLGLQSFGRRID